MVYRDHIPLPANCLKGKLREESTPLKESQNNHFMLKARTFFYEFFFLEKMLYITRLFRRQSQKNFAKFLVTLQAEGML